MTLHSKLLAPLLCLALALIGFMASSMMSDTKENPEPTTLTEAPAATKPLPAVTPPATASTTAPAAEATIATQESSNAEPQAETDQAAVKEELPGKDVHFTMDLASSTYFDVAGHAKADIGQVVFNSQLTPSNEVTLTLKLNQKGQDDLELTAHFDLANYTMELDGKNRVLNADHKQLLNLAMLHLRSAIATQYEGYDIPPHSLMLVQMLSYWSVSPEGYVHEKRSIVSR